MCQWRTIFENSPPCQPGQKPKVILPAAEMKLTFNVAYAVLRQLSAVLLWDVTGVLCSENREVKRETPSF